MLNKENYRKLKQEITILDSKEILLEVPDSFLRFSPHPYESLGAPYKDKSPFYLRRTVVKRLLIAQERLSCIKPCYRLKIFDGFRPLDVQLFMIISTLSKINRLLFGVSITEECEYTYKRRYWVIVTFFKYCALSADTLGTELIKNQDFIKYEKYSY